MMKRRCLFSIFLVLCCALHFAAAAEPDSEPKPLAYYQTQIPNDDPSSAYLDMVPYQNPIYQMYFEDMQAKGWHYNYVIEEVNGVPFTLTALHEIMYSADGQVISAQTTEDLYFFDTLRMADGEWQEFGMRIDQPTDVRWVAYQIDGVDDSGNEKSFHCLFELLEEEKPVQQMADFRVEQQMEEGRPFVVLTTDPAPVYAAKVESNEEVPYWWQYDMVFENTGDSAFTAAGFNEAGFNGEAVMYDSMYTAKRVAGWCDEEDCVIEPGERWVIECAMPVQELTAVGMRLTGTDENGAEMSFAGVIELTHGMKPE